MGVADLYNFTLQLQHLRCCTLRFDDSLWQHRHALSFACVCACVRARRNRSGDGDVGDTIERLRASCHEADVIECRDKLTSEASVFEAGTPAREARVSADTMRAWPPL